MFWRRHSILVLLVLVAVAMGTGCTTAPVTGRKQFNLFSPQEEMQMGLASFADVKKQQKISSDPKYNALVEKVGKKIAAAAANDLPNAQWEFVVFDSPEANAFCLPGGKVGVYTGILPITKDEAGLATVLGHEVAHAAARHGGERMTTSTALGLGGAVVAAVTSNQKTEEKAMWNGLYGLGASVGYALPHSRTQESEADHIGLVYMARAGYPPEEAVNFWKRFADYNKQQGGGEPWFLRTHPLDETRIKDIESWIPEARAQATEKR